MKLGIVIGHERLKPGAVMSSRFGGLAEYEFNSTIAAMISVKCFKEKIACVIQRRDSLGIELAHRHLMLEKCEAIIELHFNSFNIDTVGTEILYGENKKSKDLAQKIQSEIVGFFRPKGIGDRGIKLTTKTDRGGLSVNATPVPTVLLEPFFGSNDAECILFLDHIDLYAKAVVDGVKSFLEPKQ